MNGDLLDRVIRANYKFLFWLFVCLLVGFIGLCTMLSSIAPTVPDWIRLLV